MKTDVIDAIFKEHNLACPIKAVEIDSHLIPRSQRRFICTQLKHRLGKDYQITYNPNRFRIVVLPKHRAVA